VSQINRGELRSNQAFGSRPHAWACEVKLKVSKLLNQKLFSVARPRSKSCCHNDVMPVVPIGVVHDSAVTTATVAAIHAGPYSMSGNGLVELIFGRAHKQPNQPQMCIACNLFLGAARKSGFA
jgi:hypothetical protein